MNYEISKKAAEDLQSIWDYTNEIWSLEQADRYLDLIRNEIEFLAAFPRTGKDFGFIHPGYRAAQVKSHLIFYKIRNRKIIEVVRVLHENMDFLERIDE